MTLPSDQSAVLVTGAAGFIGRVVARRLAARGRGVIGTDLAPPPPGVAFAYVQADARDVLTLAPLLTRCDGIIHCGGISGPMLAQDNPAEVLDINIRGTVQLLDLTRRLGLRRFVGCSSVSAYGDTGAASPIDETHLLRASTVYGTSKAAGDLALQTFVARFGVSAASLRIGWVYGPGRRTDTILHPMIRSGLGGPAFALARGADQRLQFVHVEDVADALIAAFEAPSLRCPAYNVNGTEVLSIADIAAVVQRHLPEARLAIGPGLLDDTDQQGEMLLEAAARDLGWRSRVTFEAGVTAYVDWLRSNEV